MKTYTEKEVLTILALFDNLSNEGRNRLTDEQLKSFLITNSQQSINEKAFHEELKDSNINYITIDGCVNAPLNVDADQFADEFVEFIESKKYTFNGVIGPYEHEDDTDFLD